MDIIKEVCIDNIRDAISAVKLGADRIEFCSKLDEDGLTPKTEDLISIKKIVQCPIRVMVRPHSRSFVYSEQDLKEMKKTINLCNQHNFDGVVFGCLDENMELDIKKIKYLTDLSKPLKVIIHKAIDLTSSTLNSLKQLIEIKQIDGVLSSGGADTAELGLDNLKKMIAISPPKFEIISAGKITSQNLDNLHEKIQGKFYHGKKIVGNL
jgi:copper homeostasis protein